MTPNALLRGTGFSVPVPIVFKEVLEIFASVSKPLALAGLALGVLFLTIRQLISANTFPKLTVAATTKFGTHIVDRLFSFAIIAAVLGFAGFALPIFRPVDDIVYQGVVTDAATRQPIEAAKVCFLDHREIPPQTTDSEGAFYFQLPPRRQSFEAKATVSHRDYLPRTLLVILRPGVGQSDDRFKLTTIVAPRIGVTPPGTPIPPPGPTPLPQGSTPAVETSAAKFHYRKLTGTTWFDGYFERVAGSLEWREHNTLTADEFFFRETPGEPDYFTLYDSSRSFYVRIPRSGGRVEGSIALSGPWGPFLIADRVPY